MNDNDPYVLSTIENIRKVYKKMLRDEEPSKHGVLIDLINHGDTLAQSIEATLINRSNFNQEKIMKNTLVKMPIYTSLIMSPEDAGDFMQIMDRSVNIKEEYNSDNHIYVYTASEDNPIQLEIKTGVEITVDKETKQSEKDPYEQ